MSLPTIGHGPQDNNDLRDESSDGSHSGFASQSMALHARTAATALLGFAFLLIGAQVFGRTSLGRDMALVAAMQMIAAISELNIGMLLLRFLPTLGARSMRIVSLSYLLTGVIAIVASVLFLIIAPRLFDSFLYLHDSPLLMLLFVAGVVLWNSFAIGDLVLTALRHAKWVPIENTVFGALKVVGLFVFAALMFDHGVFISWVAALALVVIPTTVLIFIKPLRQHNHADKKPEDLVKSDLWRYASLDYLAAVFAQIGTSALPVVVAATLGSYINGAFAAAFAIITSLEQLSLNAGVALTVEGAFDPKKLRSLAKYAAVRFAIVLVLVVSFGLIGSPVATLLLGKEYGSDFTTILRLLLIGLIPQGVMIFAEAIARIIRKPSVVVFMNVVQAVTIIGFILLFSDRFGLSGIGYAWILSHVVVAAFALPWLISHLKRS